MVIDIHYHFVNAAFHSLKMQEEMARLCVEFAPTLSFQYSENEWIRRIRDLPNKAPEGLKFTSGEVEDVAWEC